MFLGEFNKQRPDVMLVTLRVSRLKVSSLQDVTEKQDGIEREALCLIVLDD